MIGRSLAQYEILAKVGEGGMGQVWRAHDSKLGRDVAIKVLPENMAADSDFLSRFEREARLLAGMNHPNIASIHGLEHVDGIHFLVMELVEGENLSQLLQSGPVSLEDTLSISRQIAEALDFAHQNGVVHRDLKPANVAITEEGNIKLLDFGLAKALERDPSDSSSELANSPTELLATPTASGIILGTAAYMSPEQARGKKVDRRTDIFAFGTVVYELLTGTVLFGGETVSDILAAVLRAEPDLDALPDNTPRALRNLLDRSLQKNPRRRLRDIGEACILLEDIQSGKVVDPPTVEQQPPSGSAPARKSSRIALVAGWLVAAALLIALLMTWGPQKPALIEDEPLRVLRQTIPLSNDDPSATMQFQPMISPDGRRVAYVSNGSIFLRDLSESSPRMLPDTEGGMSPFFSHDNESIGFGLGDKLYRSRLDKQGHDLVATLGGNYRLGPNARAVWDADQRIVIGTSSSAVMSVSARGGTVKEWLPLTEDEIDFHEVALLPDGEGLLVVVHSRQGYGIIDVVHADRSRSRLFEVPEGISSVAYSPSGHIVYYTEGSSAGIWAFDFSMETLERTGEPFIVAPGGREPSVSLDGTLCYLEGLQLAEAQLTWYSRTGQAIGTLGEATRTTRPFPRISPDGSQVICSTVFGAGRELYLYDTVSGNQRRLTFDEQDQEVAAWVDNSTLVCYANNSYDLSILGMDGTSKLISNGILPSVTPDRSEIILSRIHEHWDWDLLAVSLDGKQERVLVESPGVQWFGQVSPNGRYIAYQSDETGAIEVFVTTFPTASTRWQVSTEGGHQPLWNADGSEIYFTTHRTIWSAAVQADSDFRYSPPEKLFERPSIDWNASWADGFDVTDNGQRFLMWKPMPLQEGEEPRLVIVHNWYEEFRQD